MALPIFYGPEAEDSERNSLVKINTLLWSLVGAPGPGNSGAGGITSNQYSNITNATPVTADGTVLTIGVGQKGFIQNLDDAAVYVKYGTGASSASFSVVLKAGASANDGTGGSVVIDDWAGPVSIAAASGSPRVICWLLT